LLASLLKIHGVNALNNPAFCRAWLKDTAMGDLIDEITVLTLLLESKVQRRILKHRLFKPAREDIVKQLEQEFRATHESLLTPIFIEKSNLIFNVLVNVLEDMKDAVKQKEGGAHKWPTIFRNFLRK
ncbi:MAG: hypothetical protein LBK66_03620, partial [Spirochaetaceae bacterium]|jgi:hypothetical protein|nr:hypothetical protein [Spirochaetaceae bacterium]